MKRFSIWDFENLEMVNYPLTVNGSTVRFPDKAIINDGAVLIGFAIRGADAERRSQQNKELVTEQYIKRSFLTWKSGHSKERFQAMPLEATIWQFGSGRETEFMKVPFSKIDLTNSLIRLADETVLAANTGRQIETYWFFVQEKNLAHYANLT